MGRFRSMVVGPALGGLAVAIIFGGYIAASNQNKIYDIINRTFSNISSGSAMDSNYPTNDMENDSLPNRRKADGKTLGEKIFGKKEDILDSKYYLMLEAQDSALAAAYQMANDRSDRDKVRGIRERKYGVDFSDLLGGWIEDFNGPGDKIKIGIFPDRAIAISRDNRYSHEFEFPVIKTGDIYTFNLKDDDDVLYVERRGDGLLAGVSTGEYCDADIRSFRKVID